jgi:hypothetical protein
VTYRHLIAACVILPWAIGFIFLAIYILKPSPEEEVRREHDQFVHLLEQLDQTERTKAADLSKIMAVMGPEIDYAQLHKESDLNSASGIEGARQRRNLYVAQMDGFSKTLEKSWSQVKAIVDHSDLEEPFQGQLKAELTVDESDVYPKFRAWHAAMGKFIESVDNYLNTSEHYLGQFKWTDESLSFSDRKVATDISKAQSEVRLAQDNYRQLGTAVNLGQNHTLEFVQNTLRELQLQLKAQIEARKNVSEGPVTEPPLVKP